jgi:hypothetical protein
MLYSALIKTLKGFGLLLPITDFDKNFSVGRALNSKHLDKEIFFKSFHFDGDSLTTL